MVPALRPALAAAAFGLAVALGPTLPLSAADLTVRQITEQLYAADASRPLDFSNRDLAGLDLAGLAFKKARLRNSDLFGADLTGADLTHADVSRADL